MGPPQSFCPSTCSPRRISSIISLPSLPSREVTFTLPLHSSGSCTEYYQPRAGWPWCSHTAVCLVIHDIERRCPFYIGIGVSQEHCLSFDMLGRTIPFSFQAQRCGQKQTLGEILTSPEEDIQTYNPSFNRKPIPSLTWVIRENKFCWHMHPWGICFYTSSWVQSVSREQ